MTFPSGSSPPGASICPGNHDIFIRSGSYVFSYTCKGELVKVPARYSFVCKKEKTGWYILEHHSSEFPN